MSLLTAIDHLPVSRDAIATTSMRCPASTPVTACSLPPYPVDSDTIPALCVCPSTTDLPIRFAAPSAVFPATRLRLKPRWPCVR